MATTTKRETRPATAEELAATVQAHLAMPEGTPGWEFNSLDALMRDMLDEPPQAQVGAYRLLLPADQQVRQPTCDSARLAIRKMAESKRGISGRKRRALQ